MKALPEVAPGITRNRTAPANRKIFRGGSYFKHPSMQLASNLPNTLGKFSMTDRRKERQNWPTQKLPSKAVQSDFVPGTPGQRMEMVWELTKTAWEFMGKPVGESRLDKSVYRVIRKKKQDSF